eukprot:8085018-Prorocentrum_lima.AAC.1
MGMNASYTSPVDLNLLDHNKLLEVRMKDITGLHQRQNEMFDKLQIPVRRIPSDCITQGHTQGIAYDEA